MNKITSEFFNPIKLVLLWSSLLITQNYLYLTVNGDENVNLNNNLSKLVDNDNASNIDTSVVLSLTAQQIDEFSSSPSSLTSDDENTDYSSTVVTFGIRSFTIDVVTASNENLTLLTQDHLASDISSVSMQPQLLLELNSLEQRSSVGDQDVTEITESTPLEPTDNTTSEQNNNDEDIITSTLSPLSITKTTITTSSRTTTQSPFITSSTATSKSNHKINNSNLKTTPTTKIMINGPTSLPSAVEMEKNGLFRIKIAEITTDEFDNHHSNLFSSQPSNDEDNNINVERNSLNYDKLRLQHSLNSYADRNKVNIMDFYPSKIDDFIINNPPPYRPDDSMATTTIISTSTEQAQLIEFIKISSESGQQENVQKLEIPDLKIPTSKIEIELIDDSFLAQPQQAKTPNHVVDLTGELQEKDEVIKSIEENFLSFDSESNNFTTTNIPPKQSFKNVLKELGFIDRRVKKSDPHLKRVGNINPEGFVQNTKFNADSETGKTNKEKIEFSTTKFYSQSNQESVPPPAPQTPIKLNKIKLRKSSSSTTTIADHLALHDLDVNTQRSTESPKIIKKQLLAFNHVIPPVVENLDAITHKSLDTTTSANMQSSTQKIPVVDKGTTTTLKNVVEISVTQQYQSISTPTAFSPIQKPYSHQLGITRIEEKVNSLDCDLNSLPTESSMWRGNETHEQFLPITSPENCSTGLSECMPMIISWEGNTEIQSGDVLLVVIDDQLLLPTNFNETNNPNVHKTTAVYQVTRLGHEHCDITEGILLDITPLVVDGKKLVTLYDKDLTEGINLLIVVSESWKDQCVRLRVTVKSDNCGENAECSGKGICFSNTSMEGYECQCCAGFAGSHCEEIDACSPSPCTNNGICVDLSQGHEGYAYQCLCPYGYTGKNCQFESEPCNPSQCLNGGTCLGNLTNFRCECAIGFKGPLCQHNLNECLSSPCYHGICVDQEDGFRCFCQPGFAGELCNFEFNECESNPCLNGGQCNDHIGSYSCKCTKGYTGKRCHIKVDFCANDPCPEGHRCVDRGDDFTCQCPGGRNGPDCNQVPRTLCNINPCANGGTCWTSEESFYCACRPGFTGKMCEDDFVVDSVIGSNEIISDETSLRNFGDSPIGLSTKSEQLELHYIAAGTLTAAICIVAIILTVCHCKVHQTYRRFTTNRHHQLLPIFGFSFRKSTNNTNSKHWLSGKGGLQNHLQNKPSHLPPSSQNLTSTNPVRTLNRTLPLNLENDMYYTIDFSDSQNSPLIQ